MESKLTRWCDGFLEAGWLIALIVTPLFFNIHSERVFEPDKLTLLRSIALLMVFVWIVRFIEQQGWKDLSWLAWKSENSIWRQPMVLPVFIVVLIYLISSILSVAPRTSLLGSYQRLQGTYSTFSYIVIFAMIAARMRTRAQLFRLVTVVIVTSIPVSLYGLLQRYELDPLPWGGDTSSRIAGHMGNSIFIGAYLTMVIPLTAMRVIDSFYNILTDEELSYADVVRSSIYLLALAIQLIALVFTQSRGPILGLAIGLFAFVLILLVSLREYTGERFGRNPTDFAGVALTLVLAIAALFISNAAIPSLGGQRAFFLYAGIIGLLFLSLFVLAAARRGWRWLWASWLGLIVYLGLVLMVFNVSSTYPDTAASIPGASALEPTFESWSELPTINRLGQMLNQEAGTSTVRLLIWKGVLDLIAPHEPLEFPDGSTDRWNLIRPIFGYGPESMYVAYNRFYPPELATIEARNASPDRSHNETFDALVITGAAGFLAWQVLYLSAFYYAFRAIGVVRSKGGRNLLAGLWIAGALIGGILATVIASPVYIGVAAPFGSILGLVVYLVIYSLTSRPVEGQTVKYDVTQLLMIALIAGLIGYYVEIHFGIAIAATRVHSFAFMALIYVLGYRMKTQEIEAAEEVVATPAPSTRKRKGRSATPAKGVFGPVLGSMLILAVVMVTLSFDFINFTPRPDEVQSWRSASDLPSSIEIFRRSMLINPRDNFAASPYLYGVYIFSWLFAAPLLVCEMIKQGMIRVTKSSSEMAGNTRTIAAAGLALMAIIGVALFVTLSGGDAQTNTERIGAMLGAIFAVLSIAAIAALFTLPDIGREVAGAAAILGLLFSLAMIPAGNVLFGMVIFVVTAGLLYAIWDSSWNSFFQPLLIVSVGAWILNIVYSLMHSALIRGSFIAPSDSGGQPLQGLERNIVEAERIGAYLSTYYVYIIVLLLAGGLAFAWNYIRREKSAPGFVGYGALVVMLLLGFYLIDLSNLNIIQADMTYKRGKPYDQQASQLARSAGGQEAEQQQQMLSASVDSWKSAVAIYERAVEMAPNEDFYYLWLGRAYLEESSINQPEQTMLLETADTRLKRAQVINPLNTDHTANLARLNVRWAQLAPTPDEREMRIGDARDHYTDAVALSPQNSIIRNEYASLVLSLEQDCDEAIDIYADSIERDPYYEQTYLRLAETNISCAQNQTNADYLDGAIGALDLMQENVAERLLGRVLPRSETLRAQTAQAYLQLEQPEEAARILETVDVSQNDNLPAQVDALKLQVEQVLAGSE